MADFKWLSDKTVYLAIIALLVLMTISVLWYNEGFIDYETSRVYLQALTGIATLALLFYAYSTTANKREEDTARLELAVRPILAWEIWPKGQRAIWLLKSIKHPVYDLHVKLQLGAAELSITDRHVDVYDERAANHHEKDITEFLKRGLGGANSGTISLHLSCHSEVGGLYVFEFSKEVERKGRGFSFHHRKLVSAKYPWKASRIIFTDEES